MNDFSTKPIGVIHSKIEDPADAPLFYNEGAPPARLEIFPQYVEALQGNQLGTEILVVTWLHLARRDVLKVHPRGNSANPLTGVFLTRSPHRPNPLGLHRVRVEGIENGFLHLNAIEAIDGTPVVDIKAVVEAKGF